MIRIGVIGLVHDHVWLNKHLEESLELKKENKARVTCVSDPHPELTERARRILGLHSKSIYSDYVKMLNREDLDCCIVFTETYKHAEITEECAKRGIHVMVEKPMAINLKDAKRMTESAKRGKIKLFVNFPSDWNPAVRGCLKMLEELEIGRVWYLRVRVGHHGPKEAGCSNYFVKWLVSKDKAGGGALIDFCCYGAYYAAKYLGIPDRVIGTMGLFVKRDYLNVEDNAVLILEYPAAVASIEGTWSQIPGGIYIEIHGERGSVTTGLDENFYKFVGEIKAVSGRIEEMPRWSRIEKMSLPKDEGSALRYFIKVVEKDLKTNVEHALISQAILEAGIRSIKEGRKISVKDLL